MTLDELRALLVSKPGVTEETPFGPDALVYKVRGKMFALVGWNTAPLRLSLKCAPAHAQALRAEFPAIEAGYHLDKRHWITITLDDSLPEPLVLDLIDESYLLVVKKLPKSKQGDLLM
jgi:predicted DNA-binding protein (MmcQ/YjbR family)